MSLIAALDVEEIDKNNIEIIDMKNGSIKLNAQIKLEKYFTFLADNIFLDNNIDKKTDWEDYFLSALIVALNNNSKNNNINVMEIDDSLNQKPCRQQGLQYSIIRIWISFSSITNAKD